MAEREGFEQWHSLNIHLHCLFLDGVYRITEECPVFQPVRAPTSEQLHTLLNQIIKRIMKLLTRLDYLCYIARYSIRRM